MPTTWAPCPGKTKARRPSSPSRNDRKAVEDVGATLPDPDRACAGLPDPDRARTPGTSGGRAAAPGSRCRSRRGGRAGDGARDACAGESWGTCAWEGGPSVRSRGSVALTAFLLMVIGWGTRVRIRSLSARPEPPIEGRWPPAHRRIRPRFCRFRSSGRSPGSRCCRAAAWEQPLHNTAAHLP